MGKIRGKDGIRFWKWILMVGMDEVEGMRWEVFGLMGLGYNFTFLM